MSLAHPVTNHQAGGGAFATIEEGRDVLRGMLAVAVQSERPEITGLQCLCPTGSKSDAFAQHTRMFQHSSSAALGTSRRLIAGAIINDNNGRQVFPHSCNERP